MMDDEKRQAVYDDSAVLVHTFGHVLRSPLNMLRHTCTLQKTTLANVEEPVFWVDQYVDQPQQMYIDSGIYLSNISND